MSVYVIRVVAEQQNVSEGLAASWFRRDAFGNTRNRNALCKVLYYFMDTVMAFNGSCATCSNVVQ